MPRTCLFCDSTDLTNEHVWPEWIWRLFHPEATNNRYTVERHFSHHPSSLKKTSTIDQVEKIACVDCNTGWMSRVENELAKPALMPLILNGVAPQALDLDAQMVLVIWMMMRAFVHDFATEKGARRHYTQEQRRQFSVDFAPPDGTHIWGGHYLGGAKRAFASVTNLHLHPAEAPNVSYRAQFAIVTAGQLMFQVFHSFTPAGAAPLDVERTFPADLLDAMVRLWPSAEREFPWPPECSLDDESIRQIELQLQIVRSQPKGRVARDRPNG